MTLRDNQLTAIAQIHSRMSGRHLSYNEMISLQVDWLRDKMLWCVYG